MAFVLGAVDKEAQRNGKWFKYDEDTEFKLAFIGDALVSQLVDFGSSDLETPTEEDEPEVKVEKIEALMSERADKIAKHVLLDWKGVLDLDGEEVEYTEEVGKQALESDQEFFTWVMNKTTQQAHFKREARQKKAKK